MSQLKVPTFEIDSNKLLDRIQNQDTLIVPKDLRIRSEDDYGTAQVQIGSTWSGGEDVYMMPIHKAGSNPEHQIKYYHFTNHYGHERAHGVQFESIIWENEVLDFDTFDTEIACQRWRTKVERKKEHLKWLLFVWQHVTREDLPTGKASTKKRKRSERRYQPPNEINHGRSSVGLKIKLQDLKNSPSKSAHAGTNDRPSSELSLFRTNPTAGNLAENRTNRVEKLRRPVKKDTADRGTKLVTQSAMDGKDFEGTNEDPINIEDDSENDIGFDFTIYTGKFKLAAAKAKVKADMIKLGEDFDLDFYMEPDGVELSDEMIESIKAEISREKAEQERKEKEEDSEADYELPGPQDTKKGEGETEAKEKQGSPGSDYSLPGPPPKKKSDADLDREFELAFKKLESIKQEAAKIKADMAREAVEEGSDAELNLPPPRLGQIERALKRINELQSI